ncbi:MAG: helix-hairpin-helix domain-containing protein [Brachybacterium tyrofermentans]
MSDLSTSIDAVPGVGGPAARALAEQGLATVGDLVGADWTQLAQLHGVGPAAGRRLQQILEERRVPDGPARSAKRRDDGDPRQHRAECEGHHDPCDDGRPGRVRRGPECPAQP